MILGFAMSARVVEGILKITNKKGLHARAAAAFVRVVDTFKAKVTVDRDGKSVDGNSIMGLMMLGAAMGEEIHVVCEGDNAQEALGALETLVNEKFYED